MVDVVSRSLVRQQQQTCKHGSLPPPSCFSDDSVPNNVASMISLHGSTDESDAGLRPSAWLLVGID